MTRSSRAAGEVSTIDVDGKAIEVARWEGAAPPIVFLHEGLGSALQWRDFPASFGHEAFAYSRLGYGHSAAVPLPRPLDYMERDAREHLPRVLDALAIDRAILFGHSDGGSIALLFAAAHPDRGVSLVLEAPHVFVEDVSVASIAKARIAYERSDLRAKLERHHGANVDIAFRGWNDAWLDPDFRKWNIEDCLPRVKAPVLVLQGEADPYGTKAQVEAIARHVGGPVTSVLIPNCGHAPHRDAPDEVIARVRAFLETRPSREAS